ncbi:MAG: phosphoribosylformylglycinamidine synthase [Erysipelotrichaceae bacterium]|nr:phosphoribosylformylglycinamidine synthase [Erysipelotrichaceae bacterium]MDY5251739.1 phosphoribosylformylglycinamidine synthase [Erysipelotrichaceae bacterium]
MGKINKRIFIEKRTGFQVEKTDLLKELNEQLHLDVQDLRLLLVYDIFDIEEEVLAKACQTVFSEKMVDDIVEADLANSHYLAIETLPGQYDQRADSAMQCIKLLDPSSQCTITCGKVYLFAQDVDVMKIQNYLVNPIESRVKDMNVMKIDQNVEVTPLEKYDDFIMMDDEKTKAFLKEKGLAMSLEDLELVKAYFKDQEKRNPTETEIKVLDTYWSDHCRHTTFETELISIKFESKRFNDQIQKAYERYLALRQETKREHKPITLMDMATINSRYMRQNHLADDVEISDEINACSVFVDVDHDGQMEKWLLQFKNETHNHPTEIEPFGGASTCIGGAIRDPLSGRSYVYQAMRITGSGDIFTPLDQTLDGKLPQRIISKKSAHGNSSYGNQIGLATTYVQEIYHDSYVAKHLEVGAVVGAVKAENVRREKPVKGDVVILLGGKTGRDGIGGATGSSKEHTIGSLEKCASEVQKGNAPEERKIQRLFRNPQCTKLIKKCNDFGAGGVSVAIGELAEGLLIDLGKVRCKYAGLNATEIAISESQERMAVVVEAKDAQQFIELAHEENLDAYEVAVVTDDARLKMVLNGQTVVDIAREFVDSAGARQKCSVVISESVDNDVFADVALNKENILATLADKNVASQKGLVEMFDASIGSCSVMMPFGGKYQLTPTQVSVEKLPIKDGKTNACSILAYGFDPYLMEYSCFTGAMYSVLLSMAKTVSAGGNLANVYFSFQEYFERLNKDPQKWGKVTESLLGAIHVQDYFGKCAIGGKDSMSGTFNDLNVCPTLISFACSKGDVDKIITPELKKAGSKLGVFVPKIDHEGYPDLASYKQIFTKVEELSKDHKILSSYVVEKGGILSALFKMSFGNKLGFAIDSDLPLLKLIPGAIVVETAMDIEAEDYHCLGLVSEENYRINEIELTYDEAFDAWFKVFTNIYPTYHVNAKQDIKAADFVTDKTFKASELTDEVKVLLAVFPGTNCEYDTSRAFEEEGATCTTFVFKNLTEQDVLTSIDQLAALIEKTNIFVIPGGFSSGDEPDGSAKFIVNVLQNAKIKAAIDNLRQRDGLILGICNGFQALIKSGLLPYGEIKALDKDDCTLYRNDINRHISCVANTRCTSNNSPWLASNDVGTVYQIPVSHGEGKFIVSPEKLDELLANGQVAFQYCDVEGNVNDLPQNNINGSTYAIEGIVSKDGHVLGKMGHSERYVQGTFKNIYGNKKQNIFKNGVNYFRKGK